MRSVIREIPEKSWIPAAKAMAFANWRSATRYCGFCGSPTKDKSDELARQCTACGQLFFPRISPAILAVVRKDGKLLLARNARSTTGFWSLIAGFVEPGETFEDCVRREVMEEVGIEVEVDGYLGSQPWPFPDQLMLGFAARWKAGELKPDGDEIAEAGWFGPADHPPIPGHGSLSRRLIDGVFGGMQP
jgi:NAD+ diphosphatase